MHEDFRLQVELTLSGSFNFRTMQSPCLSKS